MTKQCDWVAREVLDTAASGIGCTGANMSVLEEEFHETRLFYSVEEDD